MLIGIVVLFLVILIVVLAFSSNKKTVEVRVVDKQGGNEKVEIREEVGSSSAKSAAQLTLLIVVGFPILIFVLLSITSVGDSQKSSYKEREVDPVLRKKIDELSAAISANGGEGAEYNRRREECEPFKPCNAYFETREKYQAMNEELDRLQAEAR
jgi:Na+-transporting methylmalonyl-CoA/oxaloacetate decarboxylase gamma subunit